MKTSKLIIMIIAFFGIIWGGLFSLGGDTVVAPDTESDVITQGVNMNSAVEVKQSENNDIYVLNPICIQKFDSSGKFLKGIFFDDSHKREIVNYKEYLSLSNERIIILDEDDKKVIILDKELNKIKEVSVDKDYNKDKFYMEYPETDKNNKDVKLTLFNYVKIGNEKIELDAYRNIFTSRYVAMIILLVCVTVMLIVIDH